MKFQSSNEIEIELNFKFKTQISDLLQSSTVFAICFSSPKPVTIRLTPRFANAWAQARPMPLVDPVTRATLFIIVDSILQWETAAICRKHLCQYKYVNQWNVSQLEQGITIIFNVACNELVLKPLQTALQWPQTCIIIPVNPWTCTYRQVGARIQYLYVHNHTACALTRARLRLL